MIVNGPGIVKTRGAAMELTDTSDLLPTLIKFAGAKLPTDYPIDGHSYAAFMSGETDTTREWIFEFQADRRILRTKRWLLEDNSPRHWGHLYDCGDHRGGDGYREVTDLKEPNVVSIKAKFHALLELLLAPILVEHGASNERKNGKRTKGISLL